MRARRAQPRLEARRHPGRHRRTRSARLLRRRTPADRPDQHGRFAAPYGLVPHGGGRRRQAPRPHRYGVRPGGAVLVRPDGHIAWRAADDRVPADTLKPVLARLLR
ncbi:hypothetical protein [Nonomuraea typhae]|uniref:aromatic-ring hydroxylase C-terminal domain-containing protein n=1 Tax=Nonomuraea typhae TaxID=2603600 RepID=UPI003CCD8A0D